MFLRGRHTPSKRTISRPICQSMPQKHWIKTWLISSFLHNVMKVTAGELSY